MNIFTGKRMTGHSTLYRKKIALDYRTGYEFSAGIAIYIQNLLKALNLLEDHLKPEVIIIYSPQSPLEDMKRIGYPYIQWYLYRPVKQYLPVRIINRISWAVAGIHLIKRYDFPFDADVLYPYFHSPETARIKKRYHWKPDFQEMYYPDYVSKKEYDWVISNMKSICADPDATLVLSSQDALNDFRKFFSPYQNMVTLLRFISLLPDLSWIEPESVNKKYNISTPYFIVCNQFWPHKNHLLVLHAMLLTKNNNYVVVFTGKMSSYRDTTYGQKLRDFILKNHLTDRVIFTGFLPREEQLVLMKQSVAVIQPSLFEGWSTVNEDSKAMNLFLLAGDLEVNKEQVTVNCMFFDRKNANDLATKMILVLENPPVMNLYDYKANIRRFKEELVHLFDLHAQHEMI
ncbi:MAG: glycosyltransferase [Bacteroidia bacterium]|nr:glycosyltransferase [Bacteroidia bacterium]